MYINGRHVTQFENKLDLASELKSKPLRDLSPDDEVDLENILMGEGVYEETISDVTNSEGDENAEEEVEGDVGSDDDEDEF